MVSLEKWICLCNPTQGLTLFESKKGGQYVRCKKGVCGFFTTPEKLNEYVCAVDSINEHYRAIQYPVCKHEKPAGFFMSRSEKNPGRGYFACKNSAEQKCKYFQWGDETPSKETLENWLTKKTIEMKDAETITDEMEYAVQQPGRTEEKKSLKRKKKRISELDDE